MPSPCQSRGHPPLGHRCSTFPGPRPLPQRSARNVFRKVPHLPLRMHRPRPKPQPSSPGDRVFRVVGGGGAQLTAPSSANRGLRRGAAPHPPATRKEPRSSARPARRRGVSLRRTAAGTGAEDRALLWFAWGARLQPDGDQGPSTALEAWGARLRGQGPRTEHCYGLPGAHGCGRTGAEDRGPLWFAWGARLLAYGGRGPSTALGAWGARLRADGDRAPSTEHRSGSLGRDTGVGARAGSYSPPARRGQPWGSRTQAWARRERAARGGRSGSLPVPETSPGGFQLQLPSSDTPGPALVLPRRPTFAP
ncbi:unconventional myosin-XVB-like [Oryctolagus cuniculus]|uniref:unconventional myosin-XVB-like n=1 Tax=Oryctolagus cuniculus TaxID=9986 RepID=UPI003879BF9C